MQNTHRFLCALSLVTMGAYAASVEKQEIFLDEKGELHLPCDIHAALESSFPGFQHWNVSDYHEGLRKPALAENRGASSHLVVRRTLLITTVSTTAVSYEPRALAGARTPPRNLQSGSGTDRMFRSQAAARRRPTREAT